MFGWPGCAANIDLSHDGRRGHIEDAPRQVDTGLDAMRGATLLLSGVDSNRVYVHTEATTQIQLRTWSRINHAAVVTYKFHQPLSRSTH